jgi:cell division transport system permease protein
MILFFFSEAIKSIFRSKASFILTVFSLSISVLLILSSIIALQTSDYLEKRIKEIVKINLFLKESVQEKELSEIKKDLKSKPFILQVNYTSKDEAAEIFLKETGEDFRDILDYNPLPASFVVTIKEEFSNPDSLDNIITDLNKYRWTDEVIFKNQFVYRILNFLNSIKSYLFIITGCVILIALYLVYTTVKLIMNSKAKEFETMKLVGAKLSTIKIPVLLNGLFAGILASIICVALYYFLIGYLESFKSILNLLQINRIIHLVILVFTGPVLGALVTFFTLRKLSLKI